MTLLEALLAVAIVGGLIAVAVPNYSQYVERGRTTQAMADIRLIEQSIARFGFVNNGRLPLALDEVGAVAVDPWGRPYQYLNLSTVRGLGAVRKDRALNPINTDFDLYSMGPDGESVPPLTARASRDDIVRARNGLFVGRAEDF